MRKFGIIGNPVEQSFSARYFSEKFEREGIDAEYRKYKCETIEQAQEVLSKLDGCNVTIPHKQAIIPLLKSLDETAAEIEAVNVVKDYVGYNTDCIGFMDSIRPLLRDEDQNALVLGTGGAAKAVSYGLKKLGIKPTYVSRKLKLESQDSKILGYDELTQEVMQRNTVIVNCTPLGMWPEVDGKPNIPYQYLSSEHILFDCVYNPQETQFLREGRERGARIQNGMNMLIGQAVAAWKIWNNLN